MVEVKNLTWAPGKIMWADIATAQGMGGHVSCLLGPRSSHPQQICLSLSATTPPPPPTGGASASTATIRARRRRRRGRGAMAGKKEEEEAVVYRGDKLILRGLRFHGTHGVKPEEKKLGQKFVIDVDAWMDLAAAGDSDDISDTVSYTEIYRSLILKLSSPLYPKFRIN